MWQNEQGHGYRVTLTPEEVASKDQGNPTGSDSNRKAIWSLTGGRIDALPVSPFSLGV